MTKNAVILLSGGMDSTTCLAIAKHQGYACYALSFNYGQRSVIETTAAQRIAHIQGVKQHKIITLDELGQFGTSALTDIRIDVPTDTTTGIPVTYVPARNTVFLSIALSWAETLNAHDIFLGANREDYEKYPDCRPEYIAAFEHMSNLATRLGSNGTPFTIHTPLINLDKAKIIKTGHQLGVDYELTCSCYCADVQGHACGQCNACVIRTAGFERAGLTDPTIYYQQPVTET